MLAWVKSEGILLSKKFCVFIVFIQASHSHNFIIFWKVAQNVICPNFGQVVINVIINLSPYIFLECKVEKLPTHNSNLLKFVNHMLSITIN